MVKVAQIVAMIALCAAFGFAGAVAGLVVFQDDFKGEPGAVGSQGEPGELGPMGPTGPPGQGIESLDGAYVVAGRFGCPPGTTQFGYVGGGVVTDVRFTPGIEGFSLPGIDVETEPLCVIQSP